MRCNKRGSLITFFLTLGFEHSDSLLFASLDLALRAEMAKWTICTLTATISLVVKVIARSAFFVEVGEIAWIVSRAFAKML